MKSMRLTLVAVAIATIGVAAVAQQEQKGTVRILDRINRSVVIQPTPAAAGGTIGANPPSGPNETFKVQDGVSLDAVHAGDQVTFSVSDASGTKTITKIQRQ